MKMKLLIIKTLVSTLITSDFAHAALRGSSNSNLFESMIKLIQSDQDDSIDSSFSLIGTNWKAVEIDGVQPEPIATRPLSQSTLMFAEEPGIISGIAGCNGFWGQWNEVPAEDTVPDMIRLERLQSQHLLCTDPLTAQERNIMNALWQEAIAYSVSGDGQELTLFATAVGNSDISNNENENEAVHSSLHVGRPLVRFSRIPLQHFDTNHQDISNWNDSQPGGMCVEDSDCHAKIRYRAPENPIGVDLCDCYAASKDFPFVECESGLRGCIAERCTTDTCAGFEAYCLLERDDNGMAECALRPMPIN